jgi:signal transduction histidine kinase
MLRNSLRLKFVLVNCLCALVNTAAILILFFVSNRGFTDLVGISAKNLSMLYSTGDIKSLLAKELLDWNAFSEDNVSLESFYESARNVSARSDSFQENLPESLRPSADEFIKIHNELVSQVKAIAAQKAGHVSREAIQSMASSYSRAYETLNDFSDTVVLGSEEQQGGSIRATIGIMKITLIFTLGSTFIILLVSFFYFRRHVILPIVTIADASLRAAQGRFNMIETIKSRDEIGVMAHNFNYMINEIRINVENRERISEELRTQRDQAEQANKAKSMFLANMSHELRTPMHGMLSFARFGQQKIETATKEKLKSYFDEIYESGARLMSLLNDLLDLSKLESGKIVYSLEPTDLQEIVHTVVSEMRAFAEEKGVSLEVRNTGCHLIAPLDGERIMQVARNLISNAIKFSNRGTPIDIELGQADEQLSFQIVNRGVGIPAAELETVFEKFVQSSATKTGAGGTGLGLAICKEIIHQHGGRIWAESDESIGKTKFVFMVPLRNVSAQAA